MSQKQLLYYYVYDQQGFFWTIAKTMKSAMRKARKFGEGATIHRHVRTRSGIDNIDIFEYRKDG